MPLKKTATLHANNLERNRRNRARAVAKKLFGASKIKGKQVHHKNGNNLDNKPSNLSLKTQKAHGKEHGRGNGKRGKK